MAKLRRPAVNRREFFKGAATAAAGAAAFAAAAPIADVDAQGVAQAGGRGNNAAVPPPTPEQINRDAGDVRPARNQRAAARPGSDLMVQVLKDVGIEYVAANP